MKASVVANKMAEQSRTLMKFDSHTGTSTAVDCFVSQIPNVTTNTVKCPVTDFILWGKGERSG